MPDVVVVQGDVERQPIERLEHHLASAGSRCRARDAVQPAAQRHGLVVQVAGLVAQGVERHEQMVCPV